MKKKSKQATVGMANGGNCLNVKKMEAKLGIKSVEQPLKAAGKIGKGAKKNGL